MENIDQKNLGTTINSVEILMISSGKELNFRFSSSGSLEYVLWQFSDCFTAEVELETGLLHVKPLQKKGPELVEKMKDFVDAYKAQLPIVNQLNEFVKYLAANEPFLLIIDQEVTPETRNEIHMYLDSLKSGVDYKETKARMDALFGDLLQKYDASIFNKDTKKGIGEKDKKKRVCRFCGRKDPEVSFQKVAHAISEGLGNKKIILFDECDECNGFFGEKVEPDLIKTLNFPRMFYGIKGKENKIPKVKAPEKFPVKEGKKNFSAEYDNDTLHLSYFQTDDNDHLGDSLPISPVLRTGETITDQNIYKTMCKYALSVIDAKHLPAFTETIKWIKGERELARLPKVGRLVTNEFFDHHPTIRIYVRKVDDKTLPFTIGEINFTAYTFVFIIPLCSNDDRDFLEAADYDGFWKNFKHYDSQTGWEYFDFSDNTVKPQTIKLNLDKRK